MHQKRYEGFLKTPVLWKNNAVFSLQTFEIEYKPAPLNLDINNNLRLGKYVERLVSFELQQEDTITIIAENIQIQQNKITLGELDCLLLKDEQPVHLEIIYKFYLYDATVGETEIEHFIGPNRKDSLIEKLTKLKKKQLPLLYTNACTTYLNTLHLKAEAMIQQVYFKAQLFVPYKDLSLQLNTLNTACIIGFYTNHYQLNAFKDCKFYIPNKKDWLIIPHTHVDWWSFILFKEKTKHYYEEKYSTLCWIKFNNGVLQKMFLTWW